MPDLGVQLAALALKILITGPFPAGFEDAAGPWVMAFFQSETCTEWMLKSLAIGWMV